MTRLVYRALFLLVFILAVAGGRAGAQENLDAGKKPAQLFANDCGGCHKSPAGLSKAPGMFGLESFLREHYTASRQSAAMIAGYLRSVDAEQAAAGAKRRNSEPKPKAAKRPERKPEPAEPKADPAKPDAKADAKPASEKPAEPKAAETKPIDSKPVESKPAETKPPAGSSTPAATTDKSN
jgi:hypothetical protein